MANYNQLEQPPEDTQNPLEEDEAVINALRYNLVHPEHPKEVPFKEKPKPIEHKESNIDIPRAAQASQRMIDDSGNNKAQAA